jgi:hypothetical protein
VARAVSDCTTGCWAFDELHSVPVHKDLGPAAFLDKMSAAAASQFTQSADDSGESK